MTPSFYRPALPGRNTVVAVAARIAGSMILSGAGGLGGFNPNGSCRFRVSR
jgi:hypothetical protein